MLFSRHTKRREFITLLGSTAAAWPLAARAQQPAVLGFLNGGSPGAYAPFVDAFRRGLNEFGYVEGKNLTIEFRWAEGKLDQLPLLAADLVKRRVALIAATGGFGSTEAAKAATSNIPIVFTEGGDPVESGLVASFNRPGRNVTGVTFFNTILVPKRLELVRELVPKAARVVLLANAVPVADLQDMQAAALRLGLQLQVVSAASQSEIDAMFVALVRQQATAGASSSWRWRHATRFRRFTVAASMSRSAA
jgi:putative ABC transport system substrate-binding protein